MLGMGVHGLFSSHLQTDLQILKDRFSDRPAASNVSVVTLLSHASLCKGDPTMGVALTRISTISQSHFPQGKYYSGGLNCKRNGENE